jgi:hypothetical protein
LMSSTASLAPAMVSASIGWNQPLNDITRPKPVYRRRPRLTRP